jgi:catechol 2,3-dioxygenase-like lactoylglutathione lyase family enzyme
MASIESVTLDVADLTAANRFYTAAFGLDAGVSPEGTGSHRLTIGSDAGPFTDPDGFAWEAGRL